MLPTPVLVSTHTRSAALQRRLPWLLPLVGISLVMGLGLLRWGLRQGLS
ncbi:hypothetical protein [Deinococcus humi]|uniref:Uncharacterized protein n=1 Tax=Deinococcus humi TaxID=662880 RepID=A0A7W8NCK3_9DEIO|nr:hypothetical protein [Deinococcus humi]MBB5361396.1 hypothetical protein [Deinococcus humi]